MRDQRSPHGLGVSFEGGRKAKPFRARYCFNGTIDLGRFGTAEEAQRAHDQAVFSINSQHYRATNSPPGALTAFSGDVDDRIRRYLSSLGMESAYLAPATWLHNQPAAGGQADQAAAPAPAAPAAPASGAPATYTWMSGEAPAAAQAQVAALREQQGSGAQHSGLMRGHQHADMVMIASQSPAVGMQPLPELDALLQADMEADSTDFAALLDEIFTDCAPMPGEAEAVFGTAGMQQQQVQFRTSTARPPAAKAGWASSSATAVQQQFNLLLGTRVGSPPAAAAAAGPSRSRATSMQYDTMQRSQEQQQWQPPVPGSPSMGSPAVHGVASTQYQEPAAAPAASGSGSLAQAAASGHSVAAGQQAPAAGAWLGAAGAGSGAGFWAGAHAHAHAPAAGGAALGHFLQQAASLAALQNVGELIMFVDVSVSHLTQLYSAYAVQVPSDQQYAGAATLSWSIRVRCAHPFPDASRRDEAVVRVVAAVQHLCATFVSFAAGCSATPYDCVVLQPVVEQLIKALLDLRGLCDEQSTAQGPDSSSGRVMQSWWAQQQPRAATREGQSALQLLGGLCGFPAP